jgi:hypothetical protein
MTKQTFKQSEKIKNARNGGVCCVPGVVKNKFQNNHLAIILKFKISQNMRLN